MNVAVFVFFILAFSLTETSSGQETTNPSKPPKPVSAQKPASDSKRGKTPKLSGAPNPAKVPQFAELKDAIEISCNGKSKSSTENLVSKLKLRQYIESGNLTNKNKNLETLGKRSYDRTLILLGTDISARYEEERNKWIEGQKVSRTKAGKFKMSPELTCLNDFYDAAIKESFFNALRYGKQRKCLDDKVQRLIDLARENGSSPEESDWHEFENKPTPCSEQTWNEFSSRVDSAHQNEMFSRKLKEDVAKLNNGKLPVAQKTEATSVCIACLNQGKPVEVAGGFQDQLKHFEDADRENCCKVIERVHRKLRKKGSEKPLSAEECQQIRKMDESQKWTVLGCNREAVAQLSSAAINYSPLGLMEAGNRASLATLYAEVEDKNLEGVENIVKRLSNFYENDRDDYLSCINERRQKAAWCEFLGEFTGMTLGSIVSGVAAWESGAALWKATTFVANAAAKGVGAVTGTFASMIKNAIQKARGSAINKAAGP